MDKWSDHGKQDGQISEPWTIALPYIHRPMKFVIEKPPVSLNSGRPFDATKKRRPKLKKRKVKRPPLKE